MDVGDKIFGAILKIILSHSKGCHQNHSSEIAYKITSKCHGKITAPKLVTNQSRSSTSDFCHSHQFVATKYLVRLKTVHFERTFHFGPGLSTKYLNLDCQQNTILQLQNVTKNENEYFQIIFIFLCFFNSEKIFLLHSKQLEKKKKLF